MCRAHTSGVNMVQVNRHFIQSDTSHTHLYIQYVLYILNTKKYLTGQIAEEADPQCVNTQNTVANVCTAGKMPLLPHSVAEEYTVL